MKANEKPTRPCPCFKCKKNDGIQCKDLSDCKEYMKWYEDSSRYHKVR